MILIFLLILIACFCAYKWYSDKQWQKKPLRNFPFFYRGKLFWYSRSVATTIGVFCKNTDGEWCVLANQRGKGAPDFQGFWNITCGYLEHDVTGEENCQKEIYEETGVFVPVELIKFRGVKTDPSENRQNVSLRYSAVLSGVCDNYETTDEHSEKDEVADIRWIPLSEVSDYEWAFGHEELIDKMFNEHIENKVA